ncbi:MAG: hypothetical protein IJH39_04345 [Clostridia bacterium]|nr:hypothetical protein [Clostridia bacterium]
MIIKDIRIRDFKSLYGETYFNFMDLDGLIKLSGPIGAGKTSLAEAILYGLYGVVKGQNNTSLVAWNTQECEVEMNIVSKNKEVHIKRNIREPLIVEINGKTLSASSKRNTQEILEEEIFDVPKLAVTRMCIISFNAFSKSLANMNPADTKQFLDDIFGFRLFTDYNNEIVIERKNQVNESTKLNAIYTETENQIARLKEKKEQQEREIKLSIDTKALDSEREGYVNEGKELKTKRNELEDEQDEKINVVNKEIREIERKITEASTLGKQEKSYYNTFKSGICPTCGSKIDASHIEKHRLEMMKYAELVNNYNDEKAKLKEKIEQIEEEYEPKINELNLKMKDLANKINKIDSDIKIFENNLRVVNSNYDDLIKEQEEKLKTVKEKIDKNDIEIGEWNEMNELFTKTLRYNLLNTLIPHINKSIQYYIQKLDQPYKVEYDQEFKCHIYVDTYGKEISYSNLSTGQKKTLDIAIIFGIFQNIISNVDFNVIFLDELFSNMDADSRNTMLSLIKENFEEDKSVFIMNHAEMNDDFFKHKIRVSLVSKKINVKKLGDIVVNASKYEQIF